MPLHAGHAGHDGHVRCQARRQGRVRERHGDVQRRWHWLDVQHCASGARHVRPGKRRNV